MTKMLRWTIGALALSSMAARCNETGGGRVVVGLNGDGCKKDAVCGLDAAASKQNESETVSLAEVKDYLTPYKLGRPVLAPSGTVVNIAASPWRDRSRGNLSR